MNLLEKLSELKISLPSAAKAAGLYKTILIQDRLAMFSGHLPILDDGSMITGQVGTDLTVEQGAQAARQVGLNIIASLQAEIGDLDRVERVSKLFGMVNAGPSFNQHPLVINGCSHSRYETIEIDILDVRNWSGIPFSILSCPSTPTAWLCPPISKAYCQ